MDATTMFGRARRVSCAIAVGLLAAAGMTSWTGCSEKEDNDDDNNIAADNEKYPARLDYDPENGVYWPAYNEDDDDYAGASKLPEGRRTTSFQNGKYYTIQAFLDESFLLYAAENDKLTCYNCNSTAATAGFFDGLFTSGHSNASGNNVRYDGVATLHKTGAYTNDLAFWRANSTGDGYFNLLADLGSGLDYGMALAEAWNDGAGYVRAAGGKDYAKETNKMWKAVTVDAIERYCAESYTYSSGKVECLKFLPVPGHVRLLQSKQDGQYIWLYEQPYNNTSWLGLTSDKSKAAKWVIYEYDSRP